MTRVVIVGASVAGVRTAQALRLQGFEGELILIGEERHHPYDRPPLSKEYLTADALEQPPALLSADELTQLNVELHLGVRATGLDHVNRLVHTEAESHDYDYLVIATGVVPRTLPGAELAGVRTMRTVDDAIFLRSQLASKPRVVVIGAGFIGAEFAAAARSRGCEVTIIEAKDTPMSHLLGDQVGARLAELHTQHGVTVHTGVKFDRFVGESSVEGVALSDGRLLPANLVVVGIGASPATEWLTGSGLPIEDGLECDANLRVIGHPEIYAAGDVARWRHDHYGESIRIEHWTNANEHGSLVAAAIVGASMPRLQAPYVWSDQYGHRIQIVGLPSRGELVHLTGDHPGDLFAVYANDLGIVVGGVVVDDSRRFMKLRKAVAKGMSVADLKLPAVVSQGSPRA